MAARSSAATTGSPRQTGTSAQAASATRAWWKNVSDSSPVTTFVAMASTKKVPTAMTAISTTVATGTLRWGASHPASATPTTSPAIPHTWNAGSARSPTWT